MCARSWGLVSPLLLAVLMLGADQAQAQQTVGTPAGYMHVATLGHTAGWGYKLRAPYDVAVGGDGCMYVTDIGNRSLVKISADRRFVTAVLAKAPPNAIAIAGVDPSLWAPMGVAILGDKLYVADGADLTVFGTNMVFDHVISTLSDQMGWGCGVDATIGFFGPATLYVGDIGRHRVYYRHLPQEGMAMGELVGAEVPHWGAYGPGQGEFREPCALACKLDGSAVYVLDRENHRVQEFTMEGHFSRTWGQPGSGPGQLRSPGGIAVGPDGSVFIADTGNHRAQRFSDRGEFLGQWGTRGSVTDEMGFRDPQGIAVDAQGKVYVCDTGNGVVKIYTRRLTATPGLLRTMPRP